MADRYMLLRPGVSTVWDHTWVQDYYSDGYYQKGISKSYTKISTGQYSGNTNIVIAGSTDEHTNNVVQDERTGLMWSAGLSSSVGPGSDGLLYYDDHVDVIECTTASTAFSTGALVTQANTGETGVTRYKYTSASIDGFLAIVNASTRPFSTDAADTLTDSTGGGTVQISTYHVSSKEDIWSYVRAANESSMAGHSDWRVPNVFELISLLEFSSDEGHAYASTSVFDNSTHLVWSGSMKTEDSNSVYGVRFGGGSLVNSHTTSRSCYPSLGRVRLVRDATAGEYPCKPLKTGCRFPNYGMYPDDGYYQKGKDKSFSIFTEGDYSGESTWWVGTTASPMQVEISNNCVQDLNTGLMWTRAVVVGSLASTDAFVYYYDSFGARKDALTIVRKINELQLGGHRDWRIPNAFEAASILDMYRGAPSSLVFDNSTYEFFISTHKPDSTTNIFRIVGDAGWGTGFAKISSASTGGWGYVRAVRGGYTDEDL